MKHLFLTLCCAMCALTVAAGNAAERALFERTTGRVDKGGIELTYVNTTALNRKLMELPVFVRKLCLLGGAGKELDDITEAVAILTRVINPAAFEAMAKSVAAPSGDLYIGKHFTAIKPQPSIADIFSRENSPLDWHKLPANTIAAIKFPFNGALFFSRLITELQNAKSENLRNFASMLFACKGCADSINGDILIVISGSSMNDLAVMVEIPDKQGAAGAMIKSVLPVRPNEKFSRLPLSENQMLQARAFYPAGKVVLVSHPRAMVEGNSLITVPEFKKYAALLPRSGCAYAVINISADLVDNMGKALNTPDLRRMVKPVTTLNIWTKHPDGIAAAAASNTHMNFAAAALPGIATGTAMLLPALRQARERGRRASCISNLKQIGTAIFMYLQDHLEKYPPSLQVLIQKGYLLSAQVYSCPNQPDKANGYIYVGNVLNHTIDVANTPVAFDKPGNHPDGYVTLLFANGHVECIKLQNYNDPAQVIAFLNNRAKFAPQLLDALLRAARENR